MRRRTSRRVTPNVRSFVQEISPLVYPSGQVKRLSLVDPELGESPRPEIYFHEMKLKAVGARHKKTIAGASPGTVSFLDYSISPAGAYIHFMATRPDWQNYGLSRDLLAEFMRRVRADGITTVNFGRIQSPHAWKLYQSYRNAYERDSSAIAVYGKHDF